MPPQKVVQQYFSNAGIILAGIIIFILIIFRPLHTKGQDIFMPPMRPVNAFKPGENLNFQIKYGFIVGGTTTFSLTEETYKNKPAYYVVAIGQTTGLANTLYGVKDTYESWFDPETMLPFQQKRDIKEGHYKRYNEVTYNRKNNTVNSSLSGVHPVPAKILDVVSTFYYLRRVDFSKLREGDVVLVNMYFGEEITPFRMKYAGKETIKTKFGEFNCLKICPVVEVGRMFKSQDDMTIWLTDDENCLPMLVEMDIRIVGVVNLKLVGFEQIVNPSLFKELANSRRKAKAIQYAGTEVQPTVQ